jgi:hypothetical protein
LGETAEQFGETAGQTADDFGEKFVFLAWNKYIFDTQNHMGTNENMLQSSSLWSPVRKKIF